MTQEQKYQLCEAANQYLKDTDLTQAMLAHNSKINPAYLSNMLRHIYTVKSGEKDVEIQNSYFKKLANAIGYKLESVIWHREETDQFITGYSYLKKFREDGISGKIIGDTGTGKSYLVDKFVMNNPRHNYRVTVSGLTRLKDVVEELVHQMQLDTKGAAANKVQRISDYFRRLSAEGHTPSVTIDECENMDVREIRGTKAIYDGIKYSGAIILVGTPELDEKIGKLQRQGKEGMSQFCRRFKANTRYLPAIDKHSSFEPFFQRYKISDKSFRKLLITICDNYGELNDYLFPVMKEAHKQGKPMTELMFRIYHDMPDTANK